MVRTWAITSIKRENRNPAKTFLRTNLDLKLYCYIGGIKTGPVEPGFAKRGIGTYPQSVAMAEQNILPLKMTLYYC